MTSSLFFFFNYSPICLPIPISNEPLGPANGEKTNCLQKFLTDDHLVNKTRNLNVEETCNKHEKHRQCVLKEQKEGYLTRDDVKTILDYTAYSLKLANLRCYFMNFDRLYVKVMPHKSSAYTWSASKLILAVFGFATVQISRRL